MEKVFSLIKRVICPPTKKDLHGFEYTVKELVGICENIQKKPIEHGKPLNPEVLGYKRSDTVFILGSGPSINEITDREWRHIAEHDSMGFNFWVIHSFVPTFYIFQGHSESMMNAFKGEGAKYKDVPFMVRGSSFSKGLIDFSDNRLSSVTNNPVFYIREYPISSRCSIEIDLLLRYVDALGLLTHGVISNFVPKWRGTLGLLISLCYQMGYKKIVLCGMDMHKADHFWDYGYYKKFRKKYNLPREGASNITSFTDKIRSPNTVPRYVRHLRDWMADKAGVKIFVINKGTILFPEIRKYEI